MRKGGKGKVKNVDEGEERQSQPIFLLQDTTDPSAQFLIIGYPDPENRPGDPQDLLGTCWEYESDETPVKNPWQDPPTLPQASAVAKVNCDG